MSIFRYPLAGGIVSMLLDGLDVVIADVIGLGNLPIIAEYYNTSYHAIDKYLDMYYLSFAFLVSFRWRERLAKMTSIWLFIWRAIGFVLFEITKVRILLFLAPNLFENFYLFYLMVKHYKPRWSIKTKKRLFIILFLLYIPKFGQEYLLHVTEAQPWTWFKTKYLTSLL